MDLARSWLAAIAVYLVAGTVMAAAAVGARAGEDDFADGGALAWKALPALAAFAVMVVLAAVAHPAEARRRPSRHAVAILAIPALALIGELAAGIARGSADGAVLGMAGGLAGTAAGCALVLALRRRRRAAS